MGCASSKQVKQPVCRNCHAPCSPMRRRSYSMHAHHPPHRDGDTFHVVALNSTTLGYLQVDQSIANQVQYVKDSSVADVFPEPVRQNDPEKKSMEFAVGMIEAKTWSKMIDEKIPKIAPKTPTKTPPGEPEMVNAWELMEGLEDTSPLRPLSAANHVRSFSFHVNPKSIPSPLDDAIVIKSQEKDPETELSRKPLWLQMAENDSDSNSVTNLHSNEMLIASNFDPEVITAFRKSLELLPPANPFHLKPLISEKEQSLDINGDDSSVDINRAISGGKEKLVLYFTSLRGVRKTYEDCCHVRVILKGTGVRVDERDVSMHSGFKEELKELLGDGFSGGGLPMVFAGKKYIGGAEEIRRLHEDGHLEKVLEDCEMVDDGGGGSSGSGGDGGGCGGGCEACGDMRFIPCETCSGSCKIYYEADSEDEIEEESEYGFQRCPDCNENGLIRCPICCN